MNLFKRHFISSSKLKMGFRFDKATASNALYKNAPSIKHKFTLLQDFKLKQQIELDENVIKGKIVYSFYFRTWKN